MSLKDLDIKVSYETTNNKLELLENFYLPILSESINYYRIAGFFCSTSLSIAFKGIEALIDNGGKMHLLISPEISDEDFEIFRKSSFIDFDFVFKEYSISDFQKSDHLLLLSWMLANEKLEIKIVLDKNSKHSIFHQKVGILEDSLGNMVSFSGSVNETAKAWLENIEEFKTFKSWENGQVLYLKSDLEKFSSYWNDNRQELAAVYDLTDALKKQIIQIAPQDYHDIVLMQKYIDKKKNTTSKLNLFKHQEDAVESWIQNNYMLLMEMATGTGKTRTAIGCILKLFGLNKEFITIVATPQGTLSRQWKTDVEHLSLPFEYSNIIDGTNSKWKYDLEIFILDFISGIYQNGIIYTTHKTVSSDAFIDIIKKHLLNVEVLFICDEVHGIGSDKQKKALLDGYKFRIGLSATPERMYDEYGSELIRKYFGNRSFEFTIHDALTTINPFTHKPYLNRYIYKPVFVDLNDTEITKYKLLTKAIIVLKNQETFDEIELQHLYERRSDILKNANGKHEALSKVIEELETQGRIKDTILFVSDKQRDSAMSFLSRKGIVREKITEEESASKKVTKDGQTERQDIINKFKRGDCQILIGLKCLDEGIDIPNARVAILMASSTNPREYIQRIGRVIRQSPNKANSIIFDLIVDPQDGGYSSENILKKEARRSKIIAKDAVNFDEVSFLFRERGVNINAD